MNKRCIVTGGLGFIGSNLVDVLIQKGHDVTVIDSLITGNQAYANPNAQYEECDLRKYENVNRILKSIKPQWIFHLAALPRIQPSFEDPALHDEINVRTCIELVMACRELPGLEAFVYSSSSAAYGNTEELPTTENATIMPLSPYALQKYTGERYIHILGERYNLPVTSLRYFNVYGPRCYDPTSAISAYLSVVGIFNALQLAGKPLTITGDGSQIRDFVHVSDVALANICVAENIQNANGEVYNVGSGECISILDLAHLFGDNITFIEDRKGESKITHADITKLKSLGWQPQITVQEALQRKLL